MALITFGTASQHASWLGILLAVVSAVSWAGGVVFLRQVSDAEVRGAGIISLVTGPQFLVGGAAILAVGLATERWPAAGDAGPGFAWMLALTIGTAAGWLAYLLLLERGVSPERLGGWSFGVPLTANAIGLVALGERASFSMVAGGLLVLASVAAVERFETRSPPPAAAGTVVSS